MSWFWVVGVPVAWLVTGFLLALVTGGAVRVVERHAPSLGPPAAGSFRRPVAPSFVGAVRARRRAVPLPPLGIALMAVAVSLESCGYVVRLTGATGPVARVLSMDESLSLPRMFVASVFAVAALAAAAGAGTGAGSTPGRRRWWLAVALVSGGIAAVKAGGSVHAVVLHALADAVGQRTAQLLSALAAALVVGVLWFLSRTERRDRRRVLGVLSLYAMASVGLSALSSSAVRVYGGTSHWAATATFLEESGEAVAGVAFLVAVLVGVAPRLVLPPTWALRRAADAHGVDLPERRPGRPAPGSAAAN